MDVIKLLKSKNRCLQRFLALSTDYLSEAENTRFSRLDEFQRKRDNVLKALELYEAKITETVSRLPSSDRTPELVQQVTQILADRDELIKAIFQADQKIMSLIETEKSQVLRDLNASNKSKETLKKFKSQVNEPGEELDQKL